MVALKTISAKHDKLKKDKHNKLSTSNNSGNKVTLQLNKKFGQHLLKNPGILDKIMNAAQIRNTDTVLEIGPGTGNLTIKLLKEAKSVYAIDIDERMVGEVKKRAFQAGLRNLEVSFGDALSVTFPKFDVCVANLPYQISSPFTFKLLGHTPKFRCAVLMFQKEFAERMCANPGDSCYCRLSVNVQLFARVSRVCTVKAESFSPPPKVDSVIVKILPKKTAPQLDMKEWNAFLLYCFGRKRRTLYSCLTHKSILRLVKLNYENWCNNNNNQCTESIDLREEIKKVLTELNLNDKRAVTLSSESLIKLLESFHERRIYFGNNRITSKDDEMAYMELDEDDDDTEDEAME